jgi:plasmid stabilization system protein ParE
VNLRPPRSSQRQPGGNALDYEIAQEQAAALGRLGRALEAALAALSDHDRVGHESELTAGTRRRLVREAGYALWCFIVQREASGLRDQRLIFRDYRVPPEVQNCMGLLGPGDRPRRI